MRQNGKLRLLGGVLAVTVPVVTAPVVASQTDPTPQPTAPVTSPAPTAPVTTPEPTSPVTDPTSPAPVTAPAGAITPEQFGAKGDGTGNDQAALQSALDAVKPGGTLWLAPGKTYTHSGVLKADRAGETIAGTGTVLATNEQNSSFWVTANNVTVDGPTFDVANTTKRWDAFEQMGVRIAGVSGAVLRNITVEHSAAAGIYVGFGSGGSSSNFLIDGVTVKNTRADGIHMTGGSNNGVVRNVTVSNSGDDGVAVVSYVNDGVICHDIKVEHPTVTSTSWGRGLSVVGGTNITYSDIDVSNTNAAGIYIASEGASSFNTYSSSHVTVTGGTLTNANYNANIGHGAVLVWSSEQNHNIDNVNISGLKIRNTRSGAPWQIGVNSDGGTVSAVNLSNIDVVGNWPLHTNVTSAVSATNWIVGGKAAPKL